jgi:hypothetical protein
MVALAGLVLSFAVVAGAVRAGGRYFYCDAMGMLQWDPCARGSSSRDPADPAGSVASHHVDCCQVGTLPSLPRGSTVAASSVPPPPLRAIVPVPDLLLERSASGPLGPSATSALERWRGPPRSPAARRAELMVFLT